MLITDSPVENCAILRTSSRHSLTADLGFFRFAWKEGLEYVLNRASLAHRKGLRRNRRIEPIETPISSGREVSTASVTETKLISRTTYKAPQTWPDSGTLVNGASPIARTFGHDTIVSRGAVKWLGRAMGSCPFCF